MFEIYMRDILSTWNSASNIYYTSLSRQIVLKNEIGECIGSFRFRLDLTKLNKYLTHCFDSQIYLGINNTNLPRASWKISGYMYL